VMALRAHRSPTQRRTQRHAYSATNHESPASREAFLGIAMSG
jgi:hypothetical protein